MRRKSVEKDPGNLPPHVEVRVNDKTLPFFEEVIPGFLDDARALARARVRESLNQKLFITSVGIVEQNGRDVHAIVRVYPSGNKRIVEYLNGAAKT